MAKFHIFRNGRSRRNRRRTITETAVIPNEWGGFDVVDGQSWHPLHSRRSFREAVKLARAESREGRWFNV